MDGDNQDGEELKESTWFEIFRTGRWHGRRYTADDLSTIIANFNGVDPKVPLFIGHIEKGDTMKPAEGWVSGVKKVGNKLFAKAKNVSGYLTYAVNDGRYPMRSVELYPDYDGRGLTLGGIAFLGASLPEVGGMADFKFSKKGNEDCPIYAEERDGKLCFSYLSTEKMVEDQNTTQHYHTGGGEGTMDPKELKKLMAEAISEATPEIVQQFKSGEEFQSLVRTNERLASDLEQTRNHAAATAVKADTENCIAFAKSLLDQKKITPAQFNGGGLGAFLASLDNHEELQFAKDKKQTRRAFAMDMLSSQPGQNHLFNKIDGDPKREGEDENIPGEVENFAKEHGLDPKIVAQQFAAQRRAFSSDDDGSVTTCAVSIAAAAK